MSSCSVHGIFSGGDFSHLVYDTVVDVCIVSSLVLGNYIWGDMRVYFKCLL